LQRSFRTLKIALRQPLAGGLQRARAVAHAAGVRHDRRVDAIARVIGRRQPERGGGGSALRGGGGAAAAARGRRPF
jgi:hypothetical protein